MKVAIIGAGVMGTALCMPLSDNGHEVRLIGTHLDREIILACKNQHYHPRLKRHLPENVIPYFIEEIDQAVTEVDFFISGVNSLGVRWVGETLAPFLYPGTRILSVTKGLEVDEHGDLIPLPEIMKQEFPMHLRKQVSIAAIGGPCIAGELAGRRQSCVVIGTEGFEMGAYYQQALATSYYHIWTTDDLTGLELAAALKNAYTLAVGYCHGRVETDGGADGAGAWMHNLAAACFAQGCFEIHRILEIFNTTPDFAHTLPGAGDYFVTCNKGRSYQVGYYLGQGLNMNQINEKMKGESLEAVLVTRQMECAFQTASGRVRRIDFPLMQFLIEAVQGDAHSEIPLDLFFQ